MLSSSIAASFTPCSCSRRPCGPTGVNGTGGDPPACHGDLELCSPHAWAHVVSDDLAPPAECARADGWQRSRRFRRRLLSFPVGIGPVILFGADCAVPVGQLQLGDAPRVAVARPANISDRFLADWAMDSTNPLVFGSDAPPCSFPGRVWRSNDRHYNMICCINSQTTTGGVLHRRRRSARPVVAGRSCLRPGLERRRRPVTHTAPTAAAQPARSSSPASCQPGRSAASPHLPGCLSGFVFPPQRTRHCHLQPGCSFPTARHGTLANTYTERGGKQGLCGGRLRRGE